VRIPGLRGRRGSGRQRKTLSSHNTLRGFAFDQDLDTALDDEAQRQLTALQFKGFAPAQVAAV
jgi:hypothetical protein